MENFGKFVAGIIVVVLVSIMASFVVMKLYGWILVPIYGISTITMGQAYGLGVIISLVKAKVDDEPSKFSDDIIKAVVFYACMLLLGWIASFFV